MSAAPTSTAAPASTAGPSVGPLAMSRITTSSLASFVLPSGISLQKLNGANWTHWSQTFEALLTIQEAEDIITVDTNPDPTNIGAAQWHSLMKRGNAYLCLYTDQDVYSLVASVMNSIQGEILTSEICVSVKHSGESCNGR
jgi:hypothetical protein